MKKIFIYQFGIESDDDRVGFLDRQLPVELQQRLSNYKFYTVFKPIVMNVADDDGKKCRPSSFISFPGLSPVGTKKISEGFNYKVKGEIIKSQLLTIKIQILNETNKDLNYKEYQDKIENFPNILKQIVEDTASLCGDHRIELIDTNFIYYSWSTFQKLFNARDAYQRLFLWDMVDKKKSKKESLEIIINMFKEIIDLDSQCIEAYYYLGSLYDELKDFDNAISYIHKGLKKAKGQFQKLRLNKLLKDINDEREYFEKGSNLIQKNESKRGIKFLDIWLKKHPNDWRALFFRGIGNHKLKKYNHALDDFSEAIKIKSDESALHVEYGICLSEIGNLLEAEKHFEEAVKLRPDEPNYLLNLGIVKMELNKLDEAEKYFNKSLMIKPDDELTLKCIEKIKELKSSRK